MDDKEIVPREAKNIDDMLINAMNTDPVSKGVESIPTDQPIPPDKEINASETNLDSENVDVKAEIPKEAKDNQSNVEKDSPESTIDEYGNPVVKPQKMYSEEEVQRMIRERLSRGRHAQEQHVQAQSRPIDQQNNNAEKPEENWQTELETFVESTIQKREMKAREDQIRYYEQQKQAVFEDKFTSGMNNYSDFRQVIANKPITDDMMLAIRDFENPAAFLYGASKLHGQDLERIAKLDSRSQAVEMGRLHERMVKNHRSVSKAPEPISKVAGDMVQKKSSDQIPIEARIQQYALQKRR